MRRASGKICIVLSLLVGVGCTPTRPAPPTTPPPPTADRAELSHWPTGASVRAILASAESDGSGNSDVIARAGNQVITKDELFGPMLEAHGLSFMLHMVQLELARNAASQQGITVTPEDVERERELTLERIFKESDEAIRARIEAATKEGDNDTVEKLKAELNIDRESLLDQFLAQQYVQTRQYVSRQEFELVLETNANLRKIAEKSPEIERALTEENLKKAFNATYGEKIVVRHIQSNDIIGITEARRRLQQGENFADVAKALSVNKNTAPIGGAVPPFTINASNVPEVFRQAAFALKSGEISDAVQADGAYHIIKVESRIPPKLVKYEQVRESLRADLYDKILQAAVKQLRDKLSSQTIAALHIEHPVLREQFQQRQEQGKIRQQAQIDQAMKRDRAVTAPPGEDRPAAPAPATPRTAGPEKKPAPGKPTKAKATTKPAAPRKK